jgi:hypothetical protein
MLQPFPTGSCAKSTKLAAPAAARRSQWSRCRLRHARLGKIRASAIHEPVRLCYALVIRDIERPFVPQ